MTVPVIAGGELSGQFGTVLGDQIAPAPICRLLDIHGSNPNPDAYYLALVVKQGLPVAGDTLVEPILVPGMSEFSWIPSHGGYPAVPTPEPVRLWWVVSSSPDTWVNPALNFFVSSIVLFFEF